ncbi:MAG: hypothetical protein ACK5PW_19275 [Burkholderiales bacterium]
MPGTGIHLNLGEAFTLRWIWPAEEAVERGAAEYRATSLIIRCVQTQVTLHLDMADAERLAALIPIAVAQRRADLARAKEARDVER